MNPSADTATMSAFLSDVGRFLPTPAPPVAASMRDFLDQVRRLSSGAAAEPADDRAPPDAGVGMAAFLSAVATVAARSRPRAATPDVWGLAGLRRDEVRNAAVLAWALDPLGSHGLGPAVLDALAGVLRRRWPYADGDLFPFPATVGECRVRAELNPFADLSRRVDLALDGADFTAFVEVKISASENPEQVATYLGLAERRAAATGRSRWGVVFVAPRVPPRLSADGPRVLVATWRDVGAAIRTAVPDDGDLAHQMLHQFAAHAASF